MKMMLMYTCLLGLLVCGTQALLQVSISLNKVELSVGESKFFTCTAIGEPVSINWFNPQGERIISNQRVVVHTEGVRSRLTVYNAIIEDAGIYRCQAVDATGQTQEATVVLEIYQKLTFREVKTPQEFRQSEDAEVICDVISSPVPAVSWFYKNREITSDPNSRLHVLPNNNLQIMKVTKADEGVYRCEARVEARGEIDFRDIVVLVNVPPVLTVPQQAFNATADYQESVTFTCITSGSPDPQVTWYWKGHVIERSEQYLLNSLDRGKSTLTVKNIRQGDGGPYTCRASNKAGSTESQLFLKVFVPPHITQLRNVTAVEGSAAMVSCTAEGEPVPEISWRRASDGQTFKDGDKSQDGRVEVLGRHGKSTLTFSGVQLSDWGRFDCEALSRIGGHQKSMFLDIEYAPKFQTNQTIFYSWEGNPVNISCDTRSNPPATMLWRRDRFTISSQGTSNIKIHTAEGRSILEVTPVSDRDFGRYNCTARNNIGARYQEFILAQADVPSNPTSVRLTSISQRLATVTFTKPDSHGGVPISYYIIHYKDINSPDWRTVRSHGVQTTVALANLEPNTTYEVRVAAVNGKGQGEFSRTESFQTLAIREPSPPTVHGQRGVGKAYRLGLIKQDDGGMPIVEYIVKYKTEKEEQWMTKLVPGVNDVAVLQPLQWNTRYNVEITARNLKGLSEPTFFQFLMPQKPDITDSLFSGLGLGAVVGLGVTGVLLLLVLVDVSCFFLRQCGLLMCISRKFCSKKTATGSKSKELEEGKAAYLGDGSKEPIVEMRSEERITNQQDGSPVLEPSETTPLTEPEKLPLKEENGKDVLKPDLIEIKVHGDHSLHMKQDDGQA
ncbi:neural cell adhesion molecule 2-like isoform X2 [Triplophysa dalaica]|uniref:neural cell adhesion molecule 2-like isoform X2 n=1 Tax=Triplophysa dalaica TaxID=1582913 RepID=UPI0024DFE303|nr:neural cell adhesion molecule 2-like isoform X2 [Triplophysa dalaica]